MTSSKSGIRKIDIGPNLQLEVSELTRASTEAVDLPTPSYRAHLDP